jgi:uncharacterized membrane protein
MNFPGSLFPVEWMLAAWLPVLAAVVWAVRQADWKWLLKTRYPHGFLGAVALLAILWSMKAGVKPGLNLHLVGATFLTLMAGPQFALLGLLAVLAAITANGQADWAAFGLNALVMAVVPVMISVAVLHAMERRLPAHFFIYVFVGAFFNAALSVVGLGGVTNLFLLASGAYSLDVLLHEYTLFFFLLAFSEAWLTGIVITGMVVYRPQWIATFDDARYLADK